jgi:hypothetical protein
MKITQITFTSRRGMPAYSHEEIVAVAEIRGDSDSVAQMAAVKQAVNQVLYGTAAVTASTQTVVENGQTVVDKAAIETKSSVEANTTPVSQTAADAPKEKAKRGTKNAEKEVEAKIGGKPIEEIREEKAAQVVEKTPESKDIEKYDRSIKDHTSTFAGFLTKTYGDTWKTKEGLKGWSEGLNGRDFRDAKTGILAPSFVAEIERFFGSGADVL